METEKNDNAGLRFIIILFTTEMSHLIITTLQFQASFLDTELHDLLFASAECLSQLQQWELMPLKLFPVGRLQGKVWGKLPSVLQRLREQNSSWGSCPLSPGFLKQHNFGTAQCGSHKLCRQTDNSACVWEGVCVSVEAKEHIHHYTTKEEFFFFLFFTQTHRFAPFLFSHIASALHYLMNYGKINCFYCQSCRNVETV